MLTYQDVVEHLITASSGGPQDAEQKDIRTAIQRAYQEVVQMRDWQWYHTTGRIIFSDSWQGTVTYSASTRTVTKVSGDAFPADAARHCIRIDNVVGKVATRTSDTVLVLDSSIRFPEDYTSAVSAVLYRSVYPLPSDFRNLDAPIDEASWAGFRYVSQDTAMKMERAQDIQGPPSYWTVLKDPDGYGYAVKVLGYPVDVETLDFTYRRMPRQIRLSGHEAPSRAGTVSVSGTSVTGTGTSFSSNMVGSYLRVGTASAFPDTLGSLTPFSAEAKITAVASATSATIDTSLSYSGVKYVVTDPVDAPEGMHNCMLSAAEYWLARMRGDGADKKFALYQRDLRLAMENDAVAPFSGTERVVWDTYGWRTPLQADNFDGGPA